jgi:nucleotide-binding universal stress UspA family protein
VKHTDSTKKVSFQKILYATDFSAASEAALPLVKEIARHYDSTVIGVHVRKPENYALAPADTWNALEKAWQLQGLAKAERLKAKLQGVRSEVIIREGDPREELAAIIRDLDIDLLVMGTRGRIGIEKALLGSVAEQILRQTMCPAITVGPENTDTNGSHSFEIDRILFATDFSSGSMAAAPYAISLAEENEAELDLLHVVSKEETGDLRHIGDLATDWIHRLEQIVPHDAELWCRPEYLVQIGDAAERILEMARLRHARLIVLGAKCAPSYSATSTHIPWSTAHKVIAHANCPVLTVRG